MRMQFVNTRPNSRAKPLTQFLQQHGINVVELPLLELVETPLEAAQMAALQIINQQQWVLLVSEEAVKFGLPALAKLVNLAALPKHIQWLAVGEKTAVCFVQTWRQLTDCPPPPLSYPKEKCRQNNEGLLDMPVVQALGTGDSVQIWRGVGGRELLADTLTSRGIQVTSLNFYQRILPATTLQTFEVWQAQWQPLQPIVVLITSLTAWHHWQQLIAATDRLASYHYLVLQQRIAAVMLSQYPSLNLTIINELTPKTILQALTTR